MTLLIDTSNISENSEIDANLVLSSVVMNLLMEEDVDVTDGLEISPVGKLAPIQWEALLPRLQARILLKNENKQALAADISICTLESFHDKRATQLKTGNGKFE